MSKIETVRKYSGFSLTIPRCLQNAFFCSECQIGFSTKKLYHGHLAGTARHAGKMFACKECDGVFARQSNLNAHVRDQHKLSVTLPHTCASCSKSFEHERGLRVHQGKCKIFRANSAHEEDVVTKTGDTDEV